MCVVKVFDVKGCKVQVRVSVQIYPDNVGIFSAKLPIGLVPVKNGVKKQIFEPGCGSFYVGDRQAVVPNIDHPDEPTLDKGALIRFALSAKMVSQASGIGPISIGIVQFLAFSKREANYSADGAILSLERKPLGDLMLDSSGHDGWIGPSATLKQQEEVHVEVTDNPNWKVPVHLKLQDHGGSKPYSGRLNSLKMQNRFVSYVAATFSEGGRNVFVPLSAMSWACEYDVPTVDLNGLGGDARHAASTRWSSSVTKSEWRDPNMEDLGRLGDLSRYRTANDALTDEIDFTDIEAELGDLNFL
jgi:hypothetical protein